MPSRVYLCIQTLQVNYQRTEGRPAAIETIFGFDVITQKLLELFGVQCLDR